MLVRQNINLGIIRLRHSFYHSTIESGIEIETRSITIGSMRPRLDTVANHKVAPEVRTGSVPARPIGRILAEAVRHG